jgi:hypothetical protein
MDYSEEWREQWTADVNNRFCFFNPDAPGRQGWDMVMIPFLLVILMVVPLRIGFDFEVPPGSGWFWIDVVIDVYFLLDIVVNFRTAYHNEHGQIETDTCLIAKSYMKGWFIIDFASCLPVQYFMLMMSAINGTEAGGGGSIKITKILRLVKLAKNLARLGRLKKVGELKKKYAS